MYKPTEPIRCPKCGTIVKVDLFKILTSNPKCYEWTCPNCGEKGRFHPTQKPVALLEDLILKHSHENDTVLDCFAGSGSTAVAAHNTNRNFIGCELSKEYFDKTLERFDELGFKYTEVGL